MSRLSLILVCTCLFALTGCGTTPEQSVEKLLGDGDDRAAAQQELLLAKDRAVVPLLEALEDPRYATVRPDLIQVLVSMMMRVDDVRIMEALNRHLRSDPDLKVRTHIASRFVIYNRVEAIPALFDALDDDVGDVRHQSMLALSALEGKLSEEQQELLQEKARTLVRDAHPGVREEALIRMETFVGQWIEEARQLALQARLDEADSLYNRALAYHPTSKRGNYQLARFYFDNGNVEKGLGLLRQHDMLLDVSRLRHAPTIDGILNEAEWQGTAQGDSFYTFAWQHTAAIPAKVQAYFHVGYTSEALFIGFHGYDEHPDSLVAKITESDPTRDGDLATDEGIRESIWSDDCIELFFDTNLDHKTYVHFGINSLGVYMDELQIEWRGNYDQEKRWGWAGDVEVAAHVGEDFWSLEFQLNFDQGEVPAPAPGAIWGFNMVRNFRGQQYTQWVRTYGSGLQPDDFGLLVFQ